ncbi:MAG TPA: branched-chain amino acid ABC transporter substrate-binding protein [Candidatus Limnocylindrales bacterium]|nr:branched-chain amino acid ABC transporter substrate-binding protein [Candidatus Limnocylindrales bacterium]
MKYGKLGALGAGALLVLSACSSTATTAPGSSTGAGSSTGTGGAPGAWCVGGTVKIGTELPMSGGETANGVPTENGVELLVAQVNAAGGVAGCKLATNVQDDALNGVHDPQTGAKNMQTLVADPAVIGVVGPFNSGVAEAEIPISNGAGLLMCSPANTANAVTQPPEGDTYRSAHPDKISYIRTATPDSIQGPSAADYLYKDLGKTSVYIIDDTETFGVGVGDSFEAEFKKLGGTVVKRDSAPKSTTDYTPLFTAAAAMNPQGVYLAGTTPTGMGLALKQGRTVSGMETIPFVGPDGVADLGPGGTQGATITIAGAAAANVYGTVGAAHDLATGSTFTADYTTKFGGAPGAYSAAAYACAQIIVASLTKAAATATDLASAREGVRANAVNSANSFNTALGTLSFDKYGDNTKPFISFYKTDMTLDGGKGDWVFVKQESFTDPNAP